MADPYNQSSEMMWFKRQSEPLKEEFYRKNHCEICETTPNGLQIIKQEVESMQQIIQNEKEKVEFLLTNQKKSEEQIQSMQQIIQSNKEKVEFLLTNQKQSEEQIQRSSVTSNSCMRCVKAEQQAAKCMEENEYFRKSVLEYAEKCEKAEQQAAKYKKEYEDFRKRMRGDVLQEMRNSSDLSENINDPCRESELLKMYDLLKTLHWGRAKEVLKSTCKNAKQIHETGAFIIKEIFKFAQTEMNDRKKKIKELFKISDMEINEKAHVSQKISDHVKAAVDNLQKVFFHSSEIQYQDFAKILCSRDPRLNMIGIDFIAQCCKVSCLMALHNPPLKPSWDTMEAPRTCSLGFGSRNKEQGKILFPAILNNYVVIHPPELF
ncbi:coiled-coil domain-containing protein 170 [Lepisosteus oculatus]|uniref:coiled-coil domain-containing protein 170 n=1 Tax=Lepisosteus oculatus TaxID=7918 RepID=UPI0035F5041B